MCLMSPETGAAGSTLNVLKRDLMLGTGHETCINTSSYFLGFGPSITTTFLLLIPKREKERRMLAPAPLFQKHEWQALCLVALLSFQ